MCIDIRELVPPDIYKEKGKESWRYIDSRLVEVLKHIRNIYDRPIIINTWHIGGNAMYRGLRTSESPVYKYYSDHTFGRAADFNIKDISPQQVQKDITELYADELKLLGLTAIEKDTPTWTHISVAFFPLNEGEIKNGIRILKPTGGRI